MALTEVFNLRIAGEDRLRLRELAVRAGRKESDVIRQLLRQTCVEKVSPGIPSPTLPEVQASEREGVAA